METSGTTGDREELLAYLSSFDALTIPPEVSATLERRKLRWVKGEPDRVAIAGPLAFPLLWVDTCWDEAIEHVRGMKDRTARERTVVFGRDPPRDIGPRLRAAGALTYAKLEFPEWLLAPVQAALGRLKEGRAAQWWPSVRDRPDRPPDRAVETLLTLAKLAEELLGANETSVLVRKQPDSDVCVLRQEKGPAFLVPWNEANIPDPTPFFDAADLFGGQVVLPCLDHAGCFANDDRVPPSLGGAIATVFHAGRQWRSAILLRWQEPFLPNPAEIAALESLSWVAAATWTHFGSLLSSSTEPLAEFVSHASESKERLGPERAILRTACRLAGASAGLLILRDCEEPPARLYFVCDWSKEEFPADPPPYRFLHIPCPDDPKNWPRALEAALVKSGISSDNSSFLLLPLEKDRAPAGVVVLRFRQASNGHAPNLSEDLREQGAAEFLAYGWPLMDALEHRLAQDAADKLTTDLGSVQSEDIARLLKHAATVVCDATAAGQVYAHYGSQKVGVPDGGSGVEIAAGDSSITGIARKRGTTLRILALNDKDRDLPSRQNSKGKDNLVAALGWPELQSMIVCPLDRGHGTIKVYTQAGSAFLTPQDARLVTLIAERVSRLAAPIHHRTALQALNELMAMLVGLSGKALAAQLIEKLEAWADRYLRAGSAMFVFARNGNTPFIAAESKRAGAPALADLLQLLDPRSSIGDWKVSRENFSLARGHGLTGALFLLNKNDLSESTELLLREAAREASVLLYAESARQELYQQQGILRHGLLGPAQGLMSNALFLALELERRNISSAELTSGIATIRRDADKIRMWRAENRLVASLQWNGRLEVRRRRGELRPLILACVDRFRASVTERNLSLGVDLPQGGVQASFDEETLDVALSNMIDNAVKYAFFNREIKVGVYMHRKSVSLWVEDVGHGIPDELKDSIYEPGNRVGQYDRFRVIRGEGLGLYLVRRIAEAHEGSLSHTCRLEGKTANDTTPYRVRFTLLLGGN